MDPPHDPGACWSGPASCRPLGPLARGRQSPVWCSLERGVLANRLALRGPLLAPIARRLQVARVWPEEEWELRSPMKNLDDGASVSFSMS